MKRFFKDTAALTAGGAVFAAGLCIFAAPSNIITGGAGGIAIILNSFTGLPLGTGILLVNIPLIIATVFVCGRRYTVRTVYAIVMFSAVTDIFAAAVPIKYTGNVLLACIYGGILTGLGLYIVMSQSLVTGGSDLLAYILQQIKPGKSISSLVLIIDGIIVAIGALLYKSFETALYSMALIIIMTLVLDNFLRGRSRSNLYFIFSKDPQTILRSISSDIERGSTVIDVYGGYTGERATMIMCAVSLGQSAQLRELVFKADANAFIIVAAADRVFGNGFINLDKKEIS